jgi:replicative DNA helicase
MPETAFPSEAAAVPAADRLRVPPHSIQAEQAVLGGLMLENGAWDQVADRVGERDFYRREHQLIFQAIASLAERAKPFDVVTLAEELDHKGELNSAGGFAYLGALANDTPSAANIRAYADIVRERSVIRQLIRIGTEIADSGYRPEGRRAPEKVESVADPDGSAMGTPRRVEGTLGYRPRRLELEVLSAPDSTGRRVRAERRALSDAVASPAPPR